MIIPGVQLLVVLLAFGLPGYLWVAWLHRRDRLPLSLRIVFGCAWSFAVFALLAGPFLWRGGSFAAFCRSLYALWFVFAAVAVTMRWLSRGNKEEHTAPAHTAIRTDANPEPPTGIPPCPLPLAILLAGWIIVAMIIGFVWVHPGNVDSRTLFLVIAAVLCGGGFLSHRLSPVLRPWLRFTPMDDQHAPRWSVVAAAGLIAFQTISTVVYDRPDWDDCLYQSAMVEYPHAQVLNGQEPTHREGFAMPTIQRLLCWELWGAVVCNLTGLHPMVLSHTILPGLLVLLAYASYTALFREYLPRRWVPLALIGLSAYHLWGVSGHMTAANHFLPRLWQGKAVLLHIVVPLLVVLLTRFVKAPTGRNIISLLAAMVCALGVSISAIFMGVALVACLAPGLVWLADRRRTRIGIGAGISVVPLIVCGALLMGATRNDPVLRSRPTDLATWSLAVVHYAPYGSAEVVWLVLLPLVALLLAGRQYRVYFVVFPVLLFLTFANPLLYDFVCSRVTSYHTYYRLLWLLPVGPGLGVFLALTVRLGERIATASWPAFAVRPIWLTGLAFAVTIALPGIYVWGTRNSFIGPLGTPHLAENAYKMPAGLKVIADGLLEAPDVSEGRILCDEQVASFLAPYDRRFRFVQTRPMYTAYFLQRAGRPQDGLQRHILANLFKPGRGSEPTIATDVKDIETQFDSDTATRLFGASSGSDEAIKTTEWLGHYQVRYVITGPDEQLPDPIRKAGYRLVERAGNFGLYSRPVLGALAGLTGRTP